MPKQTRENTAEGAARILLTAITTLLLLLLLLLLRQMLLLLLLLRQNVGVGIDVDGWTSSSDRHGGHVADSAQPMASDGIERCQ